MFECIGRNTRLLALACGVVFVPATSAFSQVVPAAQAPAGTYQVSICEGACAAGGANLLVTGILVLTSETFTLERLSERGQRHLRQSNPWMLVALRETEREPNACFAPESRPNASGIARVVRASITDWRSSEQGFAVRLWVSPDAGYRAVLRPDGPDLRGSGFVWGMGGEYREIAETVIATYVGPPDLDRCLQVIEAEARA